MLLTTLLMVHSNTVYTVWKVFISIYNLFTKEKTRVQTNTLITKGKKKKSLQQLGILLY